MNVNVVKYCELETFQKSYVNVHGPLSILVCSLGMVANILNICVLTTKEMRCSTNLILTGLAVADLLVMVEYIPFSYYSYINIEKRKYISHFSYAWAVFMIFHALFSQLFHFISCCLTVILALWRLLTIKNPPINKFWCDLRKTTYVILSTYLLCPIICFPLYKTYKIQEYNQTVDIYGKMVKDSDFLKSETFLEKKYVLRMDNLFYSQLSFWLYTVIIKLVPCVLLTFLSAKLLIELFEAKKRKNRLLGHNVQMKIINQDARDAKPIIAAKKKDRQADRTSGMLVTVLLLFLITEFPQAILGLLSAILGDSFHMQCYIPLDDPLCWILDWGTMLFRSPAQRLYAGFAFYSIVIGLMGFIYDIITRPPQKNIIGEYLATVSVMVYFITIYGTLMRQYENIILMLHNVMYVWNSNPPSEQLINKMNKFSLKLKKWTYLSYAMFAFYYAFFLWFQDKDKTVAFVAAKSVLGDRTILFIAIFGFIVPQALMFAYVPLFINCYFTWHIKLSLESLNEHLIKLIEFEDKCDDIMLYLYSKKQQEFIQKLMIFILDRYAKVIKLTKHHTDFVKWRLLSFSLTGILTMATDVIFIEMTKSVESTAYFGIFISALIGFFFIAETGNQIQLECELTNKLARCFKWYQWNKSNCQLLLMLLLTTKEPLQINCYGFIFQDRRLLLKVYQMIHSYITYFHSMN